jgi:MoxR-like ATPase
MKNTINTIEKNLDAAQAKKYFNKQEASKNPNQLELDELNLALKELGIENELPASESHEEITLTDEESKIASARFRNLFVSWKQFKKTEKIKEKLSTKLFSLQSISKEENNPTKYAVEINKIKVLIDQIDTKINQEIDINPELYYAYHLKGLKNYKKQSENGLVYTPYVNSQKEEVVQSLKENQNIFIHGPFGSGKTDIAIAAAREYISLSRREAELKEGLELEESEPIVLSGYRDIESHEIFGQPKLKVDENGKTYSEFDFGPVYQAIEKGLPLIIDEINSIPHSTLISLNFILEQAKHPGAIVNVKEDNGRKIISKVGFCVIATGNLPDETGFNNIIGRQEQDAAGLSRFGKKIAHGFLPQSQEADRENGVLSRTGNELYEILVSKIVNDKVYAKLHPQALEDLWKFAAFSSKIQDAYSGNTEDTIDFEGQQISISELIKGFSISWREINTVMKTWLASGCTTNLGNIIHTFVSEIPNKVAKQTLHTILEAIYDLTDNNESYNSDEMIKYGPRDIINIIYGEGPERTSESLAPYTNTKIEVESLKNQVDNEATTAIAELEKIKNQYQLRLDEFENNFTLLCSSNID